jgi:hypothetical protein
MKTQTARKARENHKAEKTTEFSFSGAPSYADKDEYISKGLIFQTKAFEFQEGRGFEGADRWAVLVALDGRPDEIITLGSNEKRDAQFRNAQEFLKRGIALPRTRLRKSGKAYYFENAEPKS